jgi:hypothetical protein
MTEFPLTAEITRILRDPDFADWVITNTRHTAAPALDEVGRLCFRFEDDEKADRLRERWLIRTSSS